LIGQILAKRCLESGIIFVSVNPYQSQQVSPKVIIFLSSIYYIINSTNKISSTCLNHCLLCNYRPKHFLNRFKQTEFVFESLMSYFLEDEEIYKIFLIILINSKTHCIKLLKYVYFITPSHVLIAFNCIA